MKRPNRRMKFVPLIGLLTLTSCAQPIQFWYQQGAVPGSANRELVNCQVAGVRNVPVNTQIGQSPSFVTPVTTSCFGGGYSIHCTQSGGDVIGGGVYSYDANSKLREALVAQCMREKGFQYITVRQCKDADLKNGLPNYRTLPPLNSNACVAKDSLGGRYVLVNP